MKVLVDAALLIAEAEEAFCDALVDWADDDGEEVCYADPSIVRIELADPSGDFVCPTLTIDFSDHSWVKVTEERVAEKLADLIAKYGILAIRIERRVDSTLYLDGRVKEEVAEAPPPTACSPRELVTTFTTALPQRLFEELQRALLKFSARDCHGQAFTHGPVTFSPTGIVVVTNHAKAGDGPPEYVGVWEEVSKPVSL